MLILYAFFSIASSVPEPHGTQKKKPQKLASESYTRYASQAEFQVNVESEEA